MYKTSIFIIFKLNSFEKGLSNNPSRRLLKEDSLTVCMKDGKPKDREIFLFNDKFLIVK